MAQNVFPLPGVQHGKRIIASVIEARAKKETDTPWVSIAINEDNLSLGFKDISFQSLNNAANHAAHWLRHNLPPSRDQFQAFAYAGPKDLRWPILAVAAAKLQKVLVLPSPLVTAEAQLRILEQKRCTVYLRPVSQKAQVDTILQDAKNIQTITIPELGEFFNETEAEPVTYPKTWDEGKDDPWLVFHTSGTTGNPKPVTYTHRMMASIDLIASLPHIKESIAHQVAMQRLYTPVPSLHMTGMLATLAMTTYLHTTAVLGPSSPPTPSTVLSVLQNASVNGGLLPPALIDGLSLIEAGLAALRRLKFVMYLGAPLAAKTANLLTPHVTITNGVGSTEGGGFFAGMHDHCDAWEYLSFTDVPGVAFERRTADGLHELVFVRDPKVDTDSDLDMVPQVFQVYPDLTRFETKDLWLPHLVHDGLWKIVGRTDDYVVLSHGDGLHASSLEPVIARHPAVKAALIGGHGRARPLLVVELVAGTNRFDVESLRPYVDKVNQRCHPSVWLDMKSVIVASNAKPFVYTDKGSVARAQTLTLYKSEIEELDR